MTQSLPSLVSVTPKTDGLATSNFQLKPVPGNLAWHRQRTSVRENVCSGRTAKLAPSVGAGLVAHRAPDMAAGACQAWAPGTSPYDGMAMPTAPGKAPRAIRHGKQPGMLPGSWHFIRMWLSVRSSSLVSPFDRLPDEGSTLPSSRRPTMCYASPCQARGIRSRAYERGHNESFTGKHSG